MKQYTKKTQHIPLNVIKRRRYAKSTMQQSKKKLYTKKNIIGGGDATRDLTNTVGKLNIFITRYILGEYFEFNQRIKDDFDRNIVSPLIANKYVKPFVFLNERTILNGTKIDNYTSLFHAIWECEKIIIEAVKLIITETKKTKFLGLLNKSGKDNYTLQNEVSRIIDLVNGNTFKIMYLMYSFIVLLSGKIKGYERLDLFVNNPFELVKTKNRELYYDDVNPTLNTILELGANDSVERMRKKIYVEKELSRSIWRIMADSKKKRMPSDGKQVDNYKNILRKIVETIRAHYLSIVNDAEKIRNKNYSEYENHTTSQEEFSEIIKKSECDSLPIICDMYRKLKPINSVFGKIEELLPDDSITETLLSKPIPSQPSSSVLVSSPRPSQQPSTIIQLKPQLTQEASPVNKIPANSMGGGRKRTGKRRKYQRKIRKTLR